MKNNTVKNTAVKSVLLKNLFIYFFDSIQCMCKISDETPYFLCVIFDKNIYIE